MLITGEAATDAVESLKRCFATALPQADLLPFVGQDRTTMVRQMFAEVKADVYVVTDGLRESLPVAQAVAAVERGDADLAVVSGLPGAAFADMGDHLLAMTLAFLFDCGAGPVDAVAVACSRRVARSYAGDGSALDLTLHALRRRLRVVEVTIPGLAEPGAAGRPRRSPRRWLALLLLIARLFAEERPRRTFGLVGLAATAAGILSAIPAIRIHDWRAGLLPGWDSAPALGLTAAGTGALAAGVLLDAMVAARQDVSRIGHSALSGGGADQSSVS